MVIGGGRVVACVVCMHDSVHRPATHGNFRSKALIQKSFCFGMIYSLLNFLFRFFSSDFPKYKFIFTKSISLYFF